MQKDIVVVGVGKNIGWVWQTAYKTTTSQQINL
jgi:hypothetical protein